MRRLFLLAAGLTISLNGQSPVQIKTGALTCGAIRRAITNGLLNVQTYCYAGSPVVSNMSSLIPAASSIIVTHTYGADSIVWQFTDSGNGVIQYQASTNGSASGFSQGNLP